LKPVRVAVVAVWIVIAIIALIPVLRGRSLSGPRPLVSSDELVKDPVCHTYVVRSRAVSRQTAAGPQYFCSADCASRFSG
jgi:YHS domain-containing protein